MEHPDADAADAMSVIDEGHGDEAARETRDGAESHDGADKEGDPDGPDGDGDPEKSGDDEKLSEKQQHAFNRLRDKEVAKRKAAEDRAKNLESEVSGLRERVDADDGDLVIESARSAGVMPEILGAGEAKGIGDLARAKSNVRALQNALEDAEGDEIAMGGQTFTRQQVRAALRTWRDTCDGLERRFGGVEAKARERALSVWRLGISAQKAGWNPGAKPAVKPDGGKKDPDEGDPDEGAPGNKGKKPAPKKDGSLPKGSASPSNEKKGLDGEVSDQRSLAAFIVGQSKKK